jgi:hypothetical protein
MPKRTNYLRGWYILLNERVDARVLELLRTMRDHSAPLRADTDVFARQAEADELATQLHTSLSREDVEANTWFKPASNFFEERPLKPPFAFARYHPDYWTASLWVLPPISPISLSREILDDFETAKIERALDEDQPWKLGGQYLFGLSLWELTARETTATEEQRRLLFLEAVDAERKKFERLKQKFSGQAGKPVPRRELIPEDVRIFVWRRDQGKCVRCGNNERLEFDHIIPVSKGGSSTARNIQLLCESCNRKKSDDL